jgi:6-phosphogluconolactonase
LFFEAKVPGLSGPLRPVSMDFSYQTSFTGTSPEAYERLLLDAMLGDATLFARCDEVEAAWALVTPILEAWEEEGEPEPYPSGSWGPDAKAAAREAAACMAEATRRVAAEKERCTLVLAGGSTPRDAYELFAGEALPWDRIHVFWTDERAVPPAHPESNFRMVQRALLGRVPIPASNIHRVRGELPADAAADAYTLELADFFDSAVPRFDLVLLGLGTDGHTASLFPFDPLVLERKLPVGVSSPRAERGRRVSLTLPAINAASQVAFLVCGAGKATVVQTVIQGARDPLRVPAQAVAQEKVIWLLDREAAGTLG